MRTGNKRIKSWSDITCNFRIHLLSHCSTIVIYAPVVYVWHAAFSWWDMFEYFMCDCCNISLRFCLLHQYCGASSDQSIDDRHDERWTKCYSDFQTRYNNVEPTEQNKLLHKYLSLLHAHFLVAEKQENIDVLEEFQTKKTAQLGEKNFKSCTNIGRCSTKNFCFQDSSERY